MEQPDLATLDRRAERRHSLIRYDERGDRLSDWIVDEFSFDAWMNDLETVVEAAAPERFALLGIPQGGAAAAAYAAHHPERVSHRLLYGAYARAGNCGASRKTRKAGRP
jgi:pimeloyl-ACP methyl ester carboxylesterase